MYPLHKLKVYEQAQDLARACYVVGSEVSDRDLRSQLLRAARAIPANLAERAGSESQAVFARYIAIALASQGNRVPPADRVRCRPPRA